MGRRAAPVTKADIMRVIRAVQNAGLPVVRIIIRPNGEVTVDTVHFPEPAVYPLAHYDAYRDIVL